MLDQTQRSLSRVITARALLLQAQSMYDDSAFPFAAAAQQEAWKSGFVSGAAWMRLILENLRGTELPPVTADFQQLGVIKYALCATGAFVWIIATLATGLWLLIPFAAFIFYAIEAQMVFLFPLALDGYPSFFRESRHLTIKSGGTLNVMLIIMRLALVMLFGGFLGKGFVRSWALGCLSVVLWYEQVKQDA